MPGEAVREMSTYRDILKAAEAVHKALDVMARSHPDDDEGVHVAYTAIEAERVALAIGVLVNLYEPESRA